MINLENSRTLANKVITIVQYYHTNRHLLTENVLVVSRSEDFDVDALKVCECISEDNLTEYSARYQYMCYNKMRRLHISSDMYQTKDEFEEFEITKEECMYACTEEGFFQLETMYYPEVVEIIAAFGFIYNSDINVDFYLDLDYLDYLYAEATKNEH